MLDYKPHDVSLSKLAGSLARAALVQLSRDNRPAEDVLNEETFGSETAAEASAAPLPL